MKLVILGGGGFRVPLVYRALLQRPALGVDEVVLHDVDEGRLAVMQAVLPASTRIRLGVTPKLTDALSGADVVFSAIRVGGADARARDERRALDHGVLGQETVGAGGIAFALRTLPVVLAAARTQAELAPDAWLINFTNPAGLVTEALQEVLGFRVIGICDSPAGLIRRAGRALGRREGTSEIRADYVGINHLGWLRALWSHGVDRLPDLLDDDDALAGFEEGRLFGPTGLRLLGSIPNEYVYFYLHARELTRTLRSGPTRGEVLARDIPAFYREAADRPDAAGRIWERHRLLREETYFAETRPATEERDDEDLAGGGYEDVALDLMQALTTNSPRELVVNAVNGSAVPGLPPDMVVEVACRIDAGGAYPLPVAPPELYQLGLMCSVRAAERAAISAVVRRSRSDALRALAIHPLVASTSTARALMDSIFVDHPELAELLR